MHGSLTSVRASDAIFSDVDEPLRVEDHVLDVLDLGILSLWLLVRFSCWFGQQKTHRSSSGRDGTEADDDDGSDLGEHFGVHAYVVSGEGRETWLECVCVCVGSVCLDAGLLEGGRDC